MGTGYKTLPADRAGYNTQSSQGIGKQRILRLHCAASPVRAAYALYLTKILHPMEPSEISRLIEAGFDDAIVKVESDDNTHFGALVVAAEFDGKRLLARHQLVYQCLGALVGNEIHALSITALTPDEWRQQSDGV